jgi:predicted transposase YbfD/YdcC
MDKAQYSTLLEALKDVPDPRQARGQRYAWLLLLTLISGALVSGQRTAHAMADWVRLHTVELRAALQVSRERLASEATLRRALRAIDLIQLEERLAHFAESLAMETPTAGTIQTTQGETLQGQAVDGKALRGARAYGTAPHLVSLVRQGSGVVLAETAVAEKSNEITAVPRLLAGRDLSGTVTTMDAMHTQRTTAQQILDQGGHYLMVVKANQPDLYQAIQLLFDQPPWLEQERPAEYQVKRFPDKGHGRHEVRTMECSPALCEYLDWPGVGLVFRRHCERLILKTGQVSHETTYGITSLRTEQAGPVQLETLCRGHWTIENRVHYVRDVTIGEDANQTHVGHAPHALAALRNAILNLFRRHNWTNIAAAFRHYGASVSSALELIGVQPARL